MARFYVAPPNLLANLSWSGAGSGDGTAHAPYDEVPYVESIRMPRPAEATHYGVVAPASGTVYYVDGQAGSDANNGTAVGTAFATLGQAATVAVSGDTIRLKEGAVPAGMPGGSVGEYHEGELGTISAGVTIESYLGAHVVFDGRAAPYTSWTQEGGVARYRADHVFAGASPFTPCLNSGQANPNSTQTTYAITSSRYLTRVECLTAFPVTKDGLLLRPATSKTISSLTRSGTTATCVTSAAHGLSTGDSVTVTNVDDAVQGANYNGCFTVTVVNATTFTYAVALTVAGGVTYPNTTAAQAGSLGMRWVSKYQVTEDAGNGIDSWYYDQKNARIYVGFDPSGHVVRAATHRTFARFTGNATVRGIVWRCYAGRYGDSNNDAVVEFSTGTQSWTNCAIGFSTGEAWNGTGPSTFRYCQAFWVRTGWSPLSGSTLYRCSGRYFNWFYGDVQGWHSGLAKAVGRTVADVAVRECQCEYSNGPCFWSDYCTTNVRFVNCRGKAGLKGGIFFEKNTAAVGSESMVAGCLFEDCYWGLALLGCRHAWLFNNSVFRASMEARLFDDGRDPTHNVQGGTLVFKNNVLVAATGSAMPGYVKVALVQVNDGVGPDGVNGSDWWAQFDYNALQLPSTVTPTTAAMPWENGNGTTNYASHASWKTAMASQPRTPGANHLSSTSTDLTTYLAGPASGHFLPAAALAGAGDLLTERQRAALGPWVGPATATRPTMGARFYPGCRD